MTDSQDSVIYLSLLNEVFKKVSHLDNLYKVMEPVRVSLQSNQDLHTFSLVKFLTKNNELSFFFQWFADTSKVVHDYDKIHEINKEYLLANINKDLKGVPDLYALLSKDIVSRVSSNQLSFFNYISREKIDFFTRTYNSTNRYLNNDYLFKIQNALAFPDTFVYNNNQALALKLDSLAYSQSFLEVGWPLLTSFAYKFALPGSAISTQGVKWLILEEICKNLSLLHTIKNNRVLSPYLYQLSLNETELYKFYQINKNTQLADSLVSPEVQKQIAQIRDKVYQNTKQKIENLIFPSEDLALLKSLLEWSYESE